MSRFLLMSQLLTQWISVQSFFRYAPDEVSQLQLLPQEKSFGPGETPFFTKISPVFRFVRAGRFIVFERVLGHGAEVVNERASRNGEDIARLPGPSEKIGVFILSDAEVLVKIADLLKNAPPDHETDPMGLSFTGGRYHCFHV